MNTEKNSAQNAEIKKENRFSRWLKMLDEKDRAMNPTKRKGKWMFALCALVILFGLSFIWFPAAKLDQHEITTPVEKPAPPKSQSTRSAFEMPADSFEIILKQKIHEDMAEKK
ncbi:MAG: hypothetical protein AB7S72_15360 [Draconibacterium sp.]